MPDRVQAQDQARKEQDGLDAFVSYSRRDSDFVLAVSKALEELGRNIWIDADDIPPGAPWRRELGTGIEAADTFVFVISPDSLASKECGLELERAIELGKRLVPVLRRDADALAPELAAIQFIDARHEQALERAVAEIERAIDTDHDWVRAHTQWLARALQWEEHRSDRSHLLRGSELQEAEAWLAAQSEGKKPPPTRLQTEYLVTSRKAEKRRLRAIVAASLVAVSVSLVLAVFALAQRGEAISQRDQAQSRELAAGAISQLPADPELSVLLAREAARRAPTTQATSALRLALGQSHVIATVRLPGGSAGEGELSDDGRVLLTAGSDRKARVWDWRTGRELAVLGGHRNPCPQAGEGPPCERFGGALSVAFGPGDLVATGGDDGSVAVWNWRTRRRLQRLAAASGPVTSVAFSPDGARVVIATERGVVVWDRRSQELEAELGPDSVNPYLHAAFSRDGTRVVAANLGGTARVWRVADGLQLGAVKTASNLHHAELSPDARHLLTADASGAAVVWDWERGRRVAVLEGHDDGLDSARFSPNGDLVLTAGADGTARVWNWASEASLVELHGHRGAVESASFGPHGRTVVTTGVDGTARIWSRLVQRSGAEVGRPSANAPPLESAAFHPDGRHVLTSGVVGPAATVWDGAGRRVASLNERGPTEAGGDLAALRGADFSRDGKLVLAASLKRGGTALLWDWRSDRAPRTLRVGGRFSLALRGRAISPDGRFVFLSDVAGTAVVWDWRARRVAARLPKRGGPPLRASFSPDGSLIATTHEDHTTRVWSWRTRRLVAQRSTPGASSAAFAPDGRTILTSGRAPQVWDWSSGRVLAELRGPGNSRAVSFDPSGELAVAAGGGTTRIWDWQAEQVVLALNGPPGLNRSVGEARFSADGLRVITAGDDGRARIYACDVCGSLEHLLRRARSYVRRALTAEERATYLHDG